MHMSVYCIHLKVRGQFLGVDSLLLPGGSQGANLGGSSLAVSASTHSSVSPAPTVESFNTN